MINTPIRQLINTASQSGIHPTRPVPTRPIPERDKLACRGRFAPLPSKTYRSQLPTHLETQAIHVTTDRARSSIIATRIITIYNHHMPTRANHRPGTPRALMKLRNHWNPLIIASLIECRRCHQPIRPGQPWELGHPTNAPYASGNRDQDLAPEHRTCNRTGLVTDQPPTFGW